jgi:hypothetical protein
MCKHARWNSFCRFRGFGLAARLETEKPNQRRDGSSDPDYYWRSGWWLTLQILFWSVCVYRTQTWGLGDTPRFNHVYTSMPEERVNYGPCIQ